MCWGSLGTSDETSPIPLTPDNQEIVRARIGIEVRSGGRSRPARMYDRVIAADDTYRIFAIPESDPGYIYIVYADHETVALLNEPEEIVIPKNMFLLSPASEDYADFYQFAEESPEVAITIICSATKLSVLEKLLSNEEYSVAAWQEVERQLMQNSKIDELSKIPEKPWPLAGVTREKVPKKITDFLGKLRISSGKAMVMKRYEFRVILKSGIK